MLHQHIADMIIFHVDTIDLLHILYGTVGVITAVHIIRLVYDHAALGESEGLKPKAVILKGRAGRFIMADMVFIQKRLSVYAAPCVHNKADRLRRMAWVKHLIIMLVFAVQMIIGKEHITV